MQRLDLLERRERNVTEIVHRFNLTQPTISRHLRVLRERELVVEDLRTHRPTLEDVFVALTGKHLRDG